MGQTKTRKLLLTWLETKHNVTILWYNIMQFITRKTRGCNILFNSANKKSFLFILYMWFGDKKRRWQLKKEALSLFVSVNALLFSMQYGQASFLCVLQPETIP
jgi:hypothetical protein